MVEQVKEPTGDRVYERMALLLRGARDCHRALDTVGEFTAYVCALRVELKRRRKLMTILDRHGLRLSPGTGRWSTTGVVVDSKVWAPGRRATAAHRPVPPAAGRRHSPAVKIPEPAEL
ncbi:hypothetical protein [Streptomyces longhuiensis]|uniref:hypothetical protein n=1 Tax=Streptomyces TaxID=1883 RepID=UPI001D09B3CE|nr:hypothetical protein [Streptomyces longhuiensis]UDM04774.1 hypothetical protein LGI35_44425 [Streptomyces longhuiensis]